MPTDSGVAQTDDDFDDDDKNGSTKETGKSDEKTFSQADIDRVVADRLAREKAKYADYADLKKKAAAAMTEQERAVAEAEQRGRSAAQVAVGSRLVKAEFKSLGAEAGIAKDALDGFLEYADLARFVAEDGEPDVKAIGNAVKRLGTNKNSSTNYDGGARTSADKPNDMNALIRQRAGL
jgi:hypothetical protein